MYQNLRIVVELELVLFNFAALVTVRLSHDPAHSPLVVNHVLALLAQAALRFNGL